MQRAVAVREVSRRKGYLLDPADDNVLSFLTLPQLRELMVQHWPCFEPYFDDRREVELALDELEVARNVVSRNRALNEAVLAQAERASARLLEILGSGAAVPSADRLPVDAVEELVGDRYADVVSVHPDRVRLQRQLPAEDLFGGARRLDAIGIGLNLLTQNFSGRRLVRLAESGCRVRLLFINPASSAVKRRERELGLKKGELSRSVEMNILHMRRVRSSSATRAPSRSTSSTRRRASRPTWWTVTGPTRSGSSSRICGAHAAWRRPCWCCAAGGVRWSGRGRTVSTASSRRTARSSSRSGRTPGPSPEASPALSVVRAKVVVTWGKAPQEEVRDELDERAAAGVRPGDHGDGRRDRPDRHGGGRPAGGGRIRLGGADLAAGSRRGHTRAGFGDPRHLDGTRPRARRPAAAAIGEIARAVADGLRSGTPLVVMNARYDLSLLDRECGRHGVESVSERLGDAPSPVIDPLVIDKHVDKYRKGKRALHALCTHYGVSLEDAHDARADALAAARVVRRMGERHQPVGVMPLEDLHGLQVHAAAEQSLSLQAYLRRTADPAAVVEPAWPLIPRRREPVGGRG